MRITKLDPYNIEQQKNKNRSNSYSQQKNIGVINKKKQISSNLNNHISFIGRLGNNLQQQYKQPVDIQYNLDQSSPLTHSKKAITHQLIFKDKKQTLVDYLQSQMKNQQRQDSKLANSKNNLKLPLISNNKVCTVNIGIDQQQNGYQNKKNTSAKNINHSSNSNYEKQGKDHQITKSNKQNPIFINIKAVIPQQKAPIQKKKDQSLRDLRIIKKQKDNDFIIEEGLNNQNSRSKINTGLIRRNKINEKQTSPLKLTADKKNSRRNSIDKINSAGNRDKKTFSINQNKKKYAVNYADFCSFISSLNKIRISPLPVVLYKAFVGKGNNSILVKTAIKNRFWWNIMSQREDIQTNFIWLQSRDNAFINQLKCSNGLQKKVTDQQNEIKKLKYHLQNKNDQKTNQSIKQFVHQGFSKLLSQKQIKQNNFTSYYAQTLINDSLGQPIDPYKIKIHNHLQSNWNLTNKKALFYNLKTYYQLIKEDPFKFIPLTFHVKKFGDQSWEQFKTVFLQRLNQVPNSKEVTKKKKKEKKEKGTLPLWIIKPGQNSNQGCGIQVSDSLQQIMEMVRAKTQNEKNRSSIIQRYLMPFLYNKRKFDIRCYMLTTSIKGVLKGYWYQQGYIRTSSKQFTTKNLKNRMIHLTNDAVQKKSEDYGKYQNGNKISFTDFQKYLDNNYSDKKLNFFKSVYPQMMRLARDSLTATCQVLDSKNREFTFEVFGLDFMIDEQFNTWLIQVNNNPCLQLSSPLLARIIPNMIENALKIAIDPLFPPPLSIPKTKALPTDIFENNKFTLIFNSGDIQQGFQHSIFENKMNLEKIIEGQEEDEQILDDEDNMFEGQSCNNAKSYQVWNEGVNKEKQGVKSLEKGSLEKGILEKESLEKESLEKEKVLSLQKDKVVSLEKMKGELEEREERKGKKIQM